MPALATFFSRQNRAPRDLKKNDNHLIPMDNYFTQHNEWKNTTYLTKYDHKQMHLQSRQIARR